MGLTTAGGSAPAQASEPAPVEVTIPEGTTLALTLDTAVASDQSRVEQAVGATLKDAISVDGITALPIGTTLAGAVTEVERAGKVKGRAHLAFRFTELTRPDDPTRYDVRTSPVSRTAAATKGKDALKVGGGALGGAIIGGIAGGKKGAAIGSAAGAGAGGAVVMSTRGDEVRLAKGASISVTLSRPLVVRVPRGTH
ncbi:MAG: hypothetical protein AB7H96_04025 [Vicinamibacterales bacterium]